MAFIQCDCFSEVLGFSISMNVILPQSTTRQIGLKGKASAGAHPTLYLLHGLSDDHTMWMRRSSIERYAGSAGIAVVMPCVHRSFYTDMKNGYNYWTFISEELPSLARSFFPLSSKREDNFVAGLSMGGYGAFKMALRCPDKFAAGASLSGALATMTSSHDYDEWLTKDMDLVLGHSVKRCLPSDDLFQLAKKVAKSKEKKPKLFQCCGTADFLFDSNTKFRDHAKKLGLDIHYEEEVGADHEWGYWDRMIEKVIAWLPIKKR